MALDIDTTARAEREVHRHATARWWFAHRRSLLVLAPLVVLAAIAQSVNMSRFPMHIDDEGTYAAQGYAVSHFGALAQYTYWYDHPPLGWLQLAGYTTVTDAFGRYGSAVDAGREFMVAVQVVGCVLLWVLCRRLLMARWSAAFAVALFSFSPLALQFHRTVYLDNIATPWLLASFALALTPQKRLSAFVGSGLCFAVAVLTKETSLLLLPAVAVLLWRGTRHSGSRRYALTLSGVAFVLAVGAYALYALIKGELLPGRGHVSLWDGVKFQLFTRTASGSVFSNGTLSNQHVAEWLQLDVVFPVAAVAATVVGLLMWRVRPIAIGFACLLLIMLKPGYLPVPYVIAMLPLAAVLVAGVVDVAAVWRPARWKTAGTRRRRWGPAVPVAIVVLVAMIVTGAPRWTGKLRGVFASNPNAPIAESTTWITHNVPRSDRLAVDDTYWLDLVRAGFPRDNVVWYYKMDTDPAVEKKSPNGWRDYDYLVLTQSVRSDPQGIGSLNTAIKNSVLVASFGSGIQRVDIRRTIPSGTATLSRTTQTATQQRRTANKDLLGNRALTISEPERGLLTRGMLDLRAASALAVLSGGGRARVESSLQEQGERNAGVPARTLVLRGVSAATVRRAVSALPAVDRTSSVHTRPDGSVLVTWALSPVPPILDF